MRVAAIYARVSSEQQRELARNGVETLFVKAPQGWLSNYKSGVEWKLDPKAIAAIQP
jgi:predicted site-specific integrase-resolvase